jgi:hypothetical protein
MFLPTEITVRYIACSPVVQNGEVPGASCGPSLSANKVSAVCPLDTVFSVSRPIVVRDGAAVIGPERVVVAAMGSG